MAEQQQRSRLSEYMRVNEKIGGIAPRLFTICRAFLYAFHHSLLSVWPFLPTGRPRGQTRSLSPTAIPAAATTLLALVSCFKENNNNKKKFYKRERERKRDLVDTRMGTNRFLVSLRPFSWTVVQKCEDGK
ncbi:uncharacterized protein B0I36DRAFT_9489 [Microdochium trichocladiopsis]|uniref:Transmembrane protein n=1 Tax=Microdochium trichocladiopsis TaxID=1682393 RepID=A0A9P9BZR0_9PEZI|nr:uncharacterized protein B0I36DRAFT_9489 [Microdochium trichocladiopsis]KAH7040379.1 hypothetical protein B0I36DRAFT_9489 [Microdochium trichocladiopsis]